MSFDESLVFLKTFGRQVDTDIEKFFRIAMTFKISKQMLKDLEDIYHKDESSRLKAVFD